MTPDEEPIVDPHVWIPTRDGTRLSGAFHWPPGFDPGRRKYPALIEYHPYRKDDRISSRAGDHNYFARHGYVTVRLDVRGTGSSEGVNTDEYMAVETRDGYDAVEWLAGQPWSNGSVGMFGSSYGGFTSYQVATLRPPHLKAIVPIYATDDRYTDDCHYKGGALKGYYDLAVYATRMIAINALPPGRAGREPGWESSWQKRLESNTPYMLNWLAHQTDGDYWRPGSLRGQYEKVAAATFIIGGWQDGYPNPPLRAYTRLRCDRKVLIGPWNHSRPAVAIPGPRIDYLREMRRWFDLWLKGEDDGISLEPPVVFYMQTFDTPDVRRDSTSGEWRAEVAWPPSGAGTRVLFLGGDASAGGGRLTARRSRPGASELEYDPAAGISGGLWSGGLTFGLAGDQRRDEAMSLDYTSTPLRRPLTIAGNAVATVSASFTAPVAMLVAKLCDVAPDGSSALVARGVLNATRRDGMSSAEPLTPGEVYELEVEIDASAWRFEAGHRIRLSISGSDFPNSWPTPGPGRLTIWHGGGRDSRLTLPTLAPPKLAPPVFEPSGAVPAGFDPEQHAWSYREDPAAGTVSLKVGRTTTADLGGRYFFYGSDRLAMTVQRRDPAVVDATGDSVARLEEPESTYEATARQRIRSDATHLNWEADLEVSVDGKPHFSKRWERRFPRELL